MNKYYTYYATIPEYKEIQLRMPANNKAVTYFISRLRTLETLSNKIS